MDTRQFTLFRRGLLVSSACCLSIVAYLSIPAGFVDTIDKVGQDTALPLETLAVEQVKVEETDNAPAPNERRVHTPATWASEDASAVGRTGRAPHKGATGVVRSIKVNNFKYWT